jgi:hypothetical protein
MATGGTEGNEHLTTITGVVLIVLLAVLGVTILQIQQLISVHLFVGLVLLGPVALKMASTGYRFARYYTRAPSYRRKGAPEPAMRMLAPGVVITTVVVFVSGIVLMFLGPAHRSTWLAIHKVSFIAWLAFTAVHVLGHLPTLATFLPSRAPALVSSRAPTLPGHRLPGNGARCLALSGAIVGGVVLAIVLIPHFAAWTASAAFEHAGDH